MINEDQNGCNQATVGDTTQQPDFDRADAFFAPSKKELANQLRQALKRIGWLEQDLERAFKRLGNQEKTTAAHYQEFIWLKEAVEIHLREQHKSVIVNVPERVTVVPDHLEIQPLPAAVQDTIDKINRATKK